MESSDLYLRARQAHVDSGSTGDAARFLSLAELQRGLESLPLPTRGEGRVALIVRRVDAGRREVLEQAWLDVEAGVAGDAWERRENRKPEMQIAVMQTEIAALIANSQPLTLFGDNFFLDLDLSAESLPIGSRVRVGEAVLEVTPQAHTGCRKFEARFGADAWRFVWLPELKSRNLRGVYMRVVTPGRVGIDDAVAVLG